MLLKNSNTFCCLSRSSLSQLTMYKVNIIFFCAYFFNRSNAFLFIYAYFPKDGICGEEEGKSKCNDVDNWAKACYLDNSMLYFNNPSSR